MVNDESDTGQTSSVVIGTKSVLENLNKNDISESFVPEKREKRHSIKKAVEIKPLFDYDLSSP